MFLHEHLTTWHVSKPLLIFYWHWPILSGLQVSKQQKQRHLIVIRQQISRPGLTRTALAYWPSLIAVDFIWELDEEEPNQLTKQESVNAGAIHGHNKPQQIQINCDIYLSTYSTSAGYSVQRRDNYTGRSERCWNWGTLVFKNRLERLVQSIYTNQKLESVSIMSSIKFSKG